MSVPTTQHSRPAYQLNKSFKHPQNSKKRDNLSLPPPQQPSRTPVRYELSNHNTTLDVTPKQHRSPDAHNITLKPVDINIMRSQIRQEQLAELNQRNYDDEVFSDH